jgi:hypothetical protein
VGLQEDDRKHAEQHHKYGRTYYTLRLILGYDNLIVVVICACFQHRDLSIPVLALSISFEGAHAPPPSARTGVIPCRRPALIMNPANALRRLGAAMAMPRLGAPMVAGPMLFTPLAAAPGLLPAVTSVRHFGLLDRISSGIKAGFSEKTEAKKRE